jgi:hypothetical protein
MLVDLCRFCAKSGRAGIRRRDAASRTCDSTAPVVCNVENQPRRRRVQTSHRVSGRECDGSRVSCWSRPHRLPEGRSTLPFIASRNGSVNRPKDPTGWTRSASESRLEGN